MLGYENGGVDYWCDDDCQYNGCGGIDRRELDHQRRGAASRVLTKQPKHVNQPDACQWKGEGKANCGSEATMSSEMLTYVSMAEREC